MATAAARELQAALLLFAMGMVAGLMGGTGIGRYLLPQTASDPQDRACHLAVHGHYEAWRDWNLGLASGMQVDAAFDQLVDACLHEYEELQQP